MEKTCEQCGKTMQKPRTVSRAAWEQRRFCSHRCHGDYNARDRVTSPSVKTCEGCGQPIHRTYEAKGIWARKRFHSNRCRTGSLHPNFKDGGRFNMAGGYIGRRLFPDNPLFAMAQVGGKVMEHRLVMAEHLGRALYADETVHHKNGDRADNRLENLELRAGRHGKGANAPHCRTCSCFAD